MRRMGYRSRRDGDNLYRIARNYNPAREVRHFYKQVYNPIGHALDHAEAFWSAMLDGRPFDAYINLFNDGGEF